MISWSSNTCPGCGAEVTEVAFVWRNPGPPGGIFEYAVCPLCQTLLRRTRSEETQAWEHVVAHAGQETRRTSPLTRRRSAQ